MPRTRFLTISGRFQKPSGRKRFQRISLPETYLVLINGRLRCMDIDFGINGFWGKMKMRSKETGASREVFKMSKRLWTHRRAEKTCLQLNRHVCEVVKISFSTKCFIFNGFCRVSFWATNTRTLIYRLKKHPHVIWNLNMSQNCFKGWDHMNGWNIWSRFAPLVESLHSIYGVALEKNWKPKKTRYQESCKKNIGGVGNCKVASWSCRWVKTISWTWRLRCRGRKGTQK